MRGRLTALVGFLTLMATLVLPLAAQEAEGGGDQGEEHPLRVLARAAVEAEIQVRKLMAKMGEVGPELGRIQRSVERSFRVVTGTMERQLF